MWSPHQSWTLVRQLCQLWGAPVVILPMPQLRQQDSAMWSCQQYFSAVSAQFSARSGHSLETWGVPPPQSPQLWVRKDGKSSNSSIMELIPFYTCCHVSCSLSLPVLHNCDTHRSRRGSQQQSGFHTGHRSRVCKRMVWNGHYTLHQICNSAHLFADILIVVAVIVQNLVTFLGSVIAVAVALMGGHASAEATALNMILTHFILWRPHLLTFSHDSLPCRWHPPVFSAISGQLSALS